MKTRKSAGAFSWLILFLLINFHNTHTLQLSTGWKQLQKTKSDAKLPGPRSGSSVWLDKDSRAWLFGGRGLSPLDVNDTQLYADLWTYSVNNGQWQKKSNCTDRSSRSCNSGREFSAMCGITGGNVVIFGGRMSRLANSSLVVVTSEMLVWRPGSSSGQWETRQCSSAEKVSCPSARYDALVWCTETEDGGHMTVVGGRNLNGRRLTDSWKLDLRRLSWTKLAPPASGCLWTAPDEPQTPTLNSSSHINESTQLALVWSSQAGGQGVYIMCDHLQPRGSNRSSTADEDINVQLWLNDANNETWRLVAESGRDSMTWPGGHTHGDTCTDTRGNLWLFGGQSQIGSSGYLNNDVWAFNVSTNVWLKVELPPEDAAEPSQRQRAASWCDQHSMFIYGGSSCDDSSDTLAECIQDDFWVLNTTVARRTENFYARDQQLRVTPIPQVVITSSVSTATPVSSSSRKPVTSNVATTHSAAHEPTTSTKKGHASNANGTGPTASTNGSTGSGSVQLDAVQRHDSEDPQVTIGRHDRILASEGSSDHGTYGSVIFFGISLSIFAAFGVVLFFRRCVSCPPRENMLLKEAPPVRYTVIPDESYAI